MSPLRRRLVVCPLSGYLSEVNSGLWLESYPNEFGAVVELVLDSVCEGDELAVVFGFTIWWHDLDGHPSYCYSVVFLAFHVVFGDDCCFGVVAGRVLLRL